MLSSDEAKHSKEKEIDPFPPSEDPSYSLEVHGDSGVDEQHESRQRDWRNGQEAERDVRSSEAHVRLQERHAGMQRAACRFERRMQAIISTKRIARMALISHTSCWGLLYSGT